MFLTIIAGVSLTAWGYLAIFHHRFWRASERLEPYVGGPPWPSVTAVIPARDEAETIGDVVRAHMASDYLGPFKVIVVDDGSSDGTGDIARSAAAEERLTVTAAPALPSGWSGKMNAVKAGIDAASYTGSKTPPEETPSYYLLTDADIVLSPVTLRRLVAKAQAEKLALVSLMARLDARGFWGGILIPAFVYFFQKLYPFPSSNDPDQPLAAAAGGCMLVCADALHAAGGIEAIHGALIDDCALADLIKNKGPQRQAIWLGLAKDEAISLRDNRSLNSIWMMVARTAFHQLRHSPWLLMGSVLGMMLLFLAPPMVAIFGLINSAPAAAALAAAAWFIMAATYRPTSALYGQSPFMAFTLPLAGLLYTLMTIDSARRHWAGKGGQWKGRHYDKT